MLKMYLTLSFRPFKGSFYDLPPSTEGETEAQRGQITGLRAPSLKAGIRPQGQCDVFPYSLKLCTPGPSGFYLVNFFFCCC